MNLKNILHKKESPSMNKDLTPEEMAKRQKAALIAWNEWKKICFVLGCQEDNQIILGREIVKAFQNKFEKIAPKDVYDIIPVYMSTVKLSSSDSAKKTEKSDWRSWVSEFDYCLTTKVHKNISQKNYKDYIWQLVAESKDPPLKVIRGKLLGPKSAINAIAENYLKVNHRILWENYIEFENNKRRLKKREVEILEENSLSEEINNDSKQTYEDKIPGKTYDCISNKELQNIIKENFSSREILLYLSSKFNMLTAKETEEYCGLKKTAIATLWNNEIMKKFQEKMPVIFSYSNLENVFFCMKNILSAEKNAEPFLNAIEERWQKKLKKYKGE